MRKPMAELWADQAFWGGEDEPSPENEMAQIAWQLKKCGWHNWITSTASQPNAKSKKCTIHPPTYINSLVRVDEATANKIVQGMNARNGETVTGCHGDLFWSYLILRYAGWCCVSSIWATCHLNMFLIICLITLNNKFKMCVSYHVPIVF